MTDEDIKKAAKQSAENHGAPDISGGYEIIDGMVYFKDKNGITSMIMEQEAFDAFAMYGERE